MKSLLHRLREDSDARHMALHRHPLLAPLDGGAITRERYGAILRAFYRAYGGVSGPDTKPALPDAPSAAWLAADLEHHGIERPARTESLRFEDVSAYVGYLYVKQGSTLGGQVISRHLNRALGLTGGADNHFFYGYGPQTGPQWKAFQAGVDAMQDDLSFDSAAAAAALMFDTIAQCCDMEAEMAHA